MPATSLKVVRGWSLVIILALLLPKDITLLPPPCICWKRKKKSTIMSRKGRRFRTILRKSKPPWVSTVTVRFW
jgi:hypothetical protein